MATRPEDNGTVVYYAGQTSCWVPRDRVAPSHRRLRLNPVTGFHEVIGGDQPPVAYPSREAAVAALALALALGPV